MKPKNLTERTLKLAVEIFVVVFVYWLGYQSAVFTVEMGGKPTPFSPYVQVENVASEVPLCEP